MFRHQHQFFGTIKPQINFDPEAVAEILHKAMKGIGCDKEEILHVLTTINNEQRQEVALQYKSMYGKDLMDSLKSELHGDFEDVIVALMMTPSVYDVRQLHQAISGMGTKEKILVEIMCSRTNEEILWIKEKYEEDYGESLEDGVKGDTSGHFERLLVALLQGNRNESIAVDYRKANQDAHELEQAGEKQWGTDESTFIKILVTESIPQLRQVLNDYEQIVGHSIEEAIRNEFSGDINEGLIALVKNIQNQPGYFAFELYQAMKGLGTKDKDLIRIIVSRSEIDLALIKQQYEQSYGRSLIDSIRSECSGAYRDTLIAIIQGN
ncbi:annexin [Loa loa]|uniref:Annexin n=1 Tax=Loa loa TaxID=7209 RepID=A0A1S0TZ50_LOALO|nr:annexin [Loa loa]EFO22551.1 annexin [Loa loa]